MMSRNLNLLKIFLILNHIHSFPPRFLLTKSQLTPCSKNLAPCPSEQPAAMATPKPALQVLNRLPSSSVSFQLGTWKYFARCPISSPTGFRDDRASFITLSACFWKEPDVRTRCAGQMSVSKFRVRFQGYMSGWDVKVRSQGQMSRSDFKGQMSGADLKVRC